MAYYESNIHCYADNLWYFVAAMAYCNGIWHLTMAYRSGQFLLVVAIGLYPIAFIICTTLSWIFLKKLRAAQLITINLIPALWIVAFIVLVY